MSLEIIRTVISKFLSNSENDVLALKGQWGAGKTYLWNSLLEENKSNIKYEAYSYVSLFGLTSTQEIKQQIVLDSISTSNPSKFDKLLAFKNRLPTISKLIKEIPYGNTFNIALEQLYPMLIKDRLICFDDFERSKIPSDVILGLINELKNEKNCKVVLIFNHAKLGELTNESYTTYREKVIDLEVEFNPSAEESAEIGLNSNLALREQLKRHIVELEIKNIRIVKKISQLSNILYNQSNLLHDGVFKRAIHTLVLGCWSYYDSNESNMKFEQLKTWNGITTSLRLNGQTTEVGVDQDKAALQRKLDVYGYSLTDSFDLAIYKFIECGYLEGTGFHKQAELLHAALETGNLQQRYNTAWEMYHNNFDDNQNLFVQELYESSRAFIEYIGIGDLDAVTVIFNELGEQKLSTELIELFIKEKINNPALMDLKGYPFELINKELIQKFNEAATQNIPKIELNVAVDKLINNQASEFELYNMRQATVNDFVNLFKSIRVDVSKYVLACLQFRHSDSNKIISDNAIAAIKEIEKTSPLNARRVIRYIRGQY